MSKKKSAASGNIAFDDYFKSLFGERWGELKQSFVKDPKYVTFSLKNCSEYYLDAASGYAACCLPLDDANNILDMCAAPGGKSLVLASRMSDYATLKANEFSKDRYIRLKRNIESCLPTDINERVSETCFDAATWCKFEKDTYDSILLDAPCSSERHVWNDSLYLAQWSHARIKNLSMKQWSLLSSAFLCLKSGGYLLYSTCALSSEENDGPIKKLLKKYPDAHLVDIDFTRASEEFHKIFHNQVCGLSLEATEFGQIVLPDKNEGAGPLFFCLIEKR